MDDVTKNEKPCTLCEEFATEALNYLSENKTQTEIIGILNKSCFRIPTFKKQVYIELWLSDNYVLKFNAVIPFFRYIHIYHQNMNIFLNVSRPSVTANFKLWRSYSDSCESCPCSALLWWTIMSHSFS